MQEVFANHYPARIQKEIDTACLCFSKNKKPLKLCFFGYIATALRKQQSLVPFEKLAKTRKDCNIEAKGGRSARAEKAAEASGQEHRYLISEDIKDKTNTLSGMSMEELLAFEKEIDSQMKGH